MSNFQAVTVQGVKVMRRSEGGRTSPTKNLNVCRGPYITLLPNIITFVANTVCATT